MAMKKTISQAAGEAAWLLFFLGLFGLAFFAEDLQGALQDGEWIRLFVSAFLHFGILHFGSNMLCLAVFFASRRRRKAAAG